jgi:hypothetical protein
VELSTTPALTAVPQLVQGAAPDTVEPTMTDSPPMTVAPPHPVQPDGAAVEAHPPQELSTAPQPVSHDAAGAGAQLLATAAPEHLVARRDPSLLSKPPPLQSLATAPLQAADFFA